MSDVGLRGTAVEAQPIRAAAASFIGTTIEWYDFFVYGTASALVFGQLIFPSTDPMNGLLASFATFAVGFFARPFGGLVFGHLGDRLGRKNTLIATILLMGLSTTAIGILPTFEKIGVWAPILLITLRILQGVSVGGEWGGAVLMASEHAPRSKKTWYASFAQLGSPAAVLLSTAAFGLASRFSGDQFMVWGWRLPFLASVVLLFVGLYIRLGVTESPEFAEVERRDAIARFPVLTAFRVSGRGILFAMLAFTIGTAGFYFTNTFLISYGTRTLALDKTVILESLSYVAIVQFLGQLAAAGIAQRIGDSRFLLIASALAMAAPYPMFLLVQTKTMPGIVAGVSIATLCASGFYAVIAGYTSKLFPPNVRYSSMSAAYQIGGAIFGGLTPMIGVLLSQRYPNEWLPLALFYSVLAGVSFTGVLLLNRFGYNDKQVRKNAEDSGSALLRPAGQ